MDSPWCPPSIVGSPWVTRLVVVLGIVVIIQIVMQEINTMRNLSFIITTTFTRHGTPIDLTWYAPQSTDINNLTYVLDATGVYGFVYNNSYPTGVPYGTYNWCNMPHVRAEEYQEPSDEYQLRYVEVIHRHHKRTVYASNSFPVESYGWDCDGEGLFYYGQPATGHKSAYTYRHGYVSPINPFKPFGFIGSCQFPQITAEGLEDSWQHGKDLYSVYHDLLRFLPDNLSGAVSFRVTQNIITSQVAGMVINGIFETQDSIEVLVEPDGFDSLEPTYSCATASSLFGSEQSSPKWSTHLTATVSLFAALDDISGVPPSDAGFHASFDHYYDNLSARQCHAKPLPCKLVNGVNSTTCVTQDIADEVYRLGNWEYSYIYRDSPTSLDVATGQFGVWIAELASHIRDVLAGNSAIIYRHNIAHDGSVSLLLAFLQIDVMAWPGMGAEVVFEVWESMNPRTTTDNSLNNHYLRVLWGGKVLRSSSPTLGLLDMVPLDLVLAYFDGLVGVGASLIKGKCDGSISY